MVSVILWWGNGRFNVLWVKHWRLCWTTNQYISFELTFNFITIQCKVVHALALGLNSGLPPLPWPSQARHTFLKLWGWWRKCGVTVAQWMLRRFLEGLLKETAHAMRRTTTVKSQATRRHLQGLWQMSFTNTQILCFFSPVQDRKLAGQEDKGVQKCCFFFLLLVAEHYHQLLKSACVHGVLCATWEF